MENDGSESGNGNGNGKNTSINKNIKFMNNVLLNKMENNLGLVKEDEVSKIVFEEVWINNK